MQIHWTLTGCDRSEETQIEEVWRSRGDELQAKVNTLGGGDTTEMRVSVEHGDFSPAWNFQAALYAPQDVMIAESQGNEIADVVDQLIGDLSQQIDEQLDLAESVQERRRGLAGVAAFLEAFHREGRGREFSSFLLPIMDSLRRYAQRELRTRRALGEIPAEELTVGDALDEALVRAWERFDTRPPSQPLDLWLVGLIDGVLQEAAQPLAEESLEQRRPPEAQAPVESRRDEWTESADEQESIELAELLPDEPRVHAWDALDVETKWAYLDEIFEQLARPARQALMLRVAEGFNPAEIADFQGRSLQEVQEDLEAAMWAIRNMLRDQDLPEMEEQWERDDLRQARQKLR